MYYDLDVVAGTLGVSVTEVENEKGLSTEELILLAGKEWPGIDAVQFLDPSLIVDDMHLVSAAQNAVNALSGNYTISRSLAVEIVVYSSGTKQIGKALQALGVKDGLPSLVLVIVGRGPEIVSSCLESLTNQVGPEVSTPFAMDTRKMQTIMDYFGVTNSELQLFKTSLDARDTRSALSRCVVSRVSQVAVEG
jgi:tRNA threonylcarbamoyladenosine modification (KEOPS) complex Cgi121 subunit